MTDINRLPPSPQLAKLESPVPRINAPFGVLLDAGDQAWRDDSFVRERARVLFEAGCRYFVCSGEGSEDLHDCIDDVIVEYDYRDVMTTFHDEPEEKVAEFFLRFGLAGTGSGLVLVDDLLKWESHLSSQKDRV